MTGEVFTYGNILKPHVEEWIAETEKGKTDLNFQDYFNNKMEANERLKQQILSEKVRYFDDTDRKKTEIIFQNKQLMQEGLDSDSKDPTGLKPLAPGSYAFVVADVKDAQGSIERKFYATPKIKTKKGLIQHSSFARGGNVVSAGMLEINNQCQLIGVRNKSGHYKPTAKELALLIKHLMDSGFDVSTLHVTQCKKYLATFCDKFKLSWGIVQQRADLWYEQTGKQLIE